MVHWPEVMMSFDETDGTLFSADAFGSYGAINGSIFADDKDFDSELLNEARRYYTNIVGKYGMQTTGASLPDDLIVTVWPTTLQFLKPSMIASRPLPLAGAHVPFSITEKLLPVNPWAASSLTACSTGE